MWPRCCRRTAAKQPLNSRWTPAGHTPWTAAGHPLDTRFKPGSRPGLTAGSTTPNDGLGGNKQPPCPSKDRSNSRTPRTRCMFLFRGLGPATVGQARTTRAPAQGGLGVSREKGSEPFSVLRTGLGIYGRVLSWQNGGADFRKRFLTPFPRMETGNTGWKPVPRRALLLSWHGHLAHGQPLLTEASR